MNTVKVSDLTVAELKNLISEIIQEKLDDIFEEKAMIQDKDYIESIKEARSEYKKGNVKNIDDLLNV